MMSRHVLVAALVLAGTSTLARAGGPAPVLDPKVAVSDRESLSEEYTPDLDRAAELQDRADSRHSLGKGMMWVGVALGAVAVTGGVVAFRTSCNADVDHCPNVIYGAYAMVFGGGASLISLVTGGIVYGTGNDYAVQAAQLRADAAAPRVSFAAAPLPGRNGVGGGQLGLSVRF
jgi:hypothetical protein